MSIEDLLSKVPEKEPELHYYRVIFESGMPEGGYSKLGPTEFLNAVLTAAGAKDWMHWVDGDGFDASRVMSVKWTNAPEGT